MLCAVSWQLDLVLTEREKTVSYLLHFQLRLRSNGELIYSGELCGEILCSVEYNPLCAEKVLCD